MSHCGHPASRWLLAGACAGGALLLAQPAQALPLVTLSSNLRLLYGLSPSIHDPDLTHLGLGLSAGVTVPASVYLGASFNYFFGDSHTTLYQQQDTGVLVTRSKATLDSYQLLAHIGYDLGLGPITLRPSLAAGVWHVNQDGGAPSPFENDSGFADVTWSTNDFAISPGAELLFSLGLLDISAELRYATSVGEPVQEYDSVFLGIGVGLSL